MSLTIDDKQYIDNTVKTESSRLEKMIVGKTDNLEKMIVTKTDNLEKMIIDKTNKLEGMITGKTDRLEKMIVGESTRLEVLLEDQRSDTTKILELLTDHIATNVAVKAHDNRLERLEQTESLILSTLNVHSREIIKLGGNTN